MKTNFLILILFFILNIPIGIKSATYIPYDIGFNTNSTSTPTFSAGEVITLNIDLNKSEFPEDKTNIEYGIAREIQNGPFTEFQPVSVIKTLKAYTDESVKTFDAIIPNVFDSYSTSTYVFYVKSYVDSDPDSGGFKVSNKNFKIKGDKNQDLINVKYMSLIMSNLNKFPLSHGPTIYNPKNTINNKVATSTSLEIIFESNVDTTVESKIKFNKLRSNVKLDDLKPKPFTIKKGYNAVYVPLPLFNYESGVYQGVITFENKQLAPVEFQYIVAGESVTFSQPTYSTSTNERVLSFEIFGSPIDRDLPEDLSGTSTLSTLSQIYKTEFILRDENGKELFIKTAEIDFSTTTYNLTFSNEIKDFTSVSIKTTNKDGKVIYETVKDLDIVFEKNNFLIPLLSIILILIILFFIFFIKRKLLNKSTAIIGFLIITITIFTLNGIIQAGGYGSVINEDPGAWKVPRSAPYVTFSGVSSGNINVYNNELIDDTKIRFNEDIRTKLYQEGEDIKLMFRASFVLCENTSFAINVGFSTTSIQDARSKKTGLLTSGIISVSNTIYLSGTDFIDKGKHIAVTLPYRQINIGKLKRSENNNLYIFHEMKNSRTQTEEYKIPITGVYPALSPVSGNQNTATGSAQSGLDDAGCRCEGRRGVCQINNSDVYTENASGCKFKIYCSASLDENNVNFTLINENTLGSEIKYEYDGQSVTRSKDAPYTISKPKTPGNNYLSFKAIDLGDNSEYLSSCSIDNVSNNNTPINNSSSSTINILNTSSSSIPSIYIGKTGQCNISWSIENMPSGVTCKLTDLSKNIIPVSGNNNLQTSGTWSPGVLPSNQKYTITCSGGSLSPALSKSVICRLDPKINEN